MTVVCSLSNAVHLFGMNMMIFLTYVVTSVGTLTLLVLSSLRGLQHFSQRQVVFYLLALCLSPCSHRNCLVSRTHKNSQSLSRTSPSQCFGGLNRGPSYQEARTKWHVQEEQIFPENLSKDIPRNHVLRYDHLHNTYVKN